MTVCFEFSAVIPFKRTKKFANSALITLLKIPVHKPSHTAHSGPTSAIDCGRPANDETCVMFCLKNAISPRR